MLDTHARYKRYVRHLTVSRRQCFQVRALLYSDKLFYIHIEKIYMVVLISEFINELEQEKKKTGK